MAIQVDFELLNTPCNRLRMRQSLQTGDTFKDAHACFAESMVLPLTSSFT